MLKTELLAAVQQIANLQYNLNGHELDCGHGTEFAYATVYRPSEYSVSDSEPGAWGACDILMRRILGEIFGSEDRANRVLSYVYDNGEDIAYNIERVREDDEAEAYPEESD